MALAPAARGCRQSSLNMGLTLPVCGHRGKRLFIASSSLCADLPSASSEACTTRAGSDGVLFRGGSSGIGPVYNGTCRAAVGAVTSNGRLSVTWLNMWFEVNGLFRRLRRISGAAYTGSLPSGVAKRRGLFCALLIIQITLLFSTVSNGAWQLCVAAAALSPASTLSPVSSLSPTDDGRLSLAFPSGKARRKTSGFSSLSALEIREEAQSEPDHLSGTPSFASVATAAAFDGVPGQTVAGVGPLSVVRTPAGGFPSAGVGSESASASFRVPVAAAPASSQTTTPFPLQSSGTDVPREVSLRASAASALSAGELSAAVTNLSSVSPLPEEPVVGPGSLATSTPTSGSAALTPPDSPAFVSTPDNNGSGGPAEAAFLIPNSGPASVYASSVEAAAKPETGGLQQGPVRERYVRPYSTGPTARAVSFAASSGIPLCHECSSFSETSSDGGCPRMCLHGEKTPNFMMPIRALRTIDTHPQEVVQLLEANHHAHLNLNKNFYVLRGKGPFGSLGNNAATLPRKEDAFAAAKLGLHFPELPHISFAQMQASEHTAATAAAATATGGTAASNSAQSANAFDSEDPEKDAHGGVTEHLKLTLAEASVPIMQMKDSQYVGLLGIGTPLQYVEPVFDTGSTNLWVVGSDCKDDTCEKVTRFDPKASSTYRPTNPPVNLDITFGTGRINGCTAVDNFSIGPFLVKDQTFGLVQKESGHNMHGNIFKSIHFEGIVGLAFPEMSSTGAVPLYDHLVQDGKLKANEFAFYMAKGYPVSGLFFGGVDPRFFEPPIHMFPVSREHYWETELDAIYIGDDKFCCDTPSFVILDSGTSFNTLPGKDMRRLMEKIPPRECDLNDPEFTETYKPITYVIRGVKFPLQPEEYLVRNDRNECKPAFMQIDVPAEYGPAYILGSVAFMRHYYTVYRRSDAVRPALVGIARAVHNEENKAYLANVLKDFPGVSELTKKGVLSLEKSLSSFTDKEL